MKVIISIFAALFVVGCMQSVQNMRNNEPKDSFLLKGDYRSAADCVFEGVNVNTPLEARLNVYQAQQYAEIIPTPDPFYMVVIRPTEQPNISRGEVLENVSSAAIYDWGKNVRVGIGDCLAN